MLEAAGLELPGRPTSSTVHRAHEGVALVAGVLAGGVGQLADERVVDLGEAVAVVLGAGRR